MGGPWWAIWRVSYTNFPTVLLQSTPSALKTVLIFFVVESECVWQLVEI
jgi:hypothetical protein